MNDYSRSDQIVRFRVYEALAVEEKSALGGTMSGSDGGVKTFHVERWLGEVLPLGNRWQSYLGCQYRVSCIVAPLTSRANVCCIREDIHQLAFTLVSKLAAQDDCNNPLGHRSKAVNLTN